MSGWVAGATVVGSLIGANASSKAASTQASAARDAAALQNEQFQQTRQDQMPWLKAGEQALNKLIPMTDYTKFGMDQFTADPGYAFRLSEGQKALDRSAAARGGLISGRALKEAGRYGQEMGSQEYMNAFNRYQTERNAALNPLQSLAGVGQTTATNLGTAGAANAANVGNLMTGGAAAQAAGYVGQANAFNSGLGTYLNYSNNNALLNALNRNRGGFTSTGGTGLTNTPYDFSGVSEYERN
jgi:hypothetical protein